MSEWLLLGGTGFVGRTVIDQFLGRNISDPIPDRITVANRSGYMSTEGILLYQRERWDAEQVSKLPPIYDVIIHAATPASAELNAQDPARMFSINVKSMENVIEFASKHQTPPVVLFTSSGGVYGDIPPEIDHVPENWLGAVDPTKVSSAYAEGKRAAEFLLSAASAQGICKGLIARLFAFSGVHLPLDRHFAIGNFVRDAVTANAISVRSDGRSVRSYLDGQDMAQWLLRIIEVGSPGEIYHVGSERAISIRDLALLVAQRYELLTTKPVNVEILGQSSPLDSVSHYVPLTKWTRHRLGVSETISLEESIDQMIINALRMQNN